MMGGACSEYGEEERRVQGFGGGRNLREKDNLGDLRVDGQIILRWIFRIWNWGVWTSSSWLRIGTRGGYL